MKKTKTRVVIHRVYRFKSEKKKTSPRCRDGIDYF